LSIFENPDLLILEAKKMGHVANLILHILHASTFLLGEEDGIIPCARLHRVLSKDVSYLVGALRLPSNNFTSSDREAEIRGSSVRLVMPTGRSTVPAGLR
jgi:hypothetical protein